MWRHAVWEMRQLYQPSDCLICFWKYTEFQNYTKSSQLPDSKTAPPDLPPPHNKQYCTPSIRLLVKLLPCTRGDTQDSRPWSSRNSNPVWSEAAQHQTMFRENVGKRPWVVIKRLEITTNRKILYKLVNRFFRLGLEEIFWNTKHEGWICIHVFRECTRQLNDICNFYRIRTFRSIGHKGEKKN
jgi:hypothetical protein